MRTNGIALSVIWLIGCAGEPSDTGDTDTAAADTDEPDTDVEEMVTAIDVGECEGSPEEMDADGGLSATAAGSTVTVAFGDVDANCCPSPSAVIERGVQTLSVALSTSDGSEGECDCWCIQDFTVPVENVAAGTWTVYGSVDGSEFGEAAVVVE